MMRIEYSRAFGKELLRLTSALQDEFDRREQWFRRDPYDPLLKTHHLKGNLKDYWAFRIAKNCRVVFSFETKTKVTFHHIGTHDQAYRE